MRGEEQAIGLISKVAILLVVLGIAIAIIFFYIYGYAIPLWGSEFEFSQLCLEWTKVDCREDAAKDIEIERGEETVSLQKVCEDMFPGVVSVDDLYKKCREKCKGCPGEVQ